MTSKEIVAPRVYCQSKHHLSKFLEGVIENEGEGVVLRRGRSRYEHGRSSSLLKLKATVADAEGLIVGINDQTITIQLTNEETFEVTHDKASLEGDAQLKKGDIVTFTFEKYSKGDIPIDPRIYRIRKDISWEQAVARVQTAPNKVSQAVLIPSPKPFGYWMSDKQRRMRLFLEKHARSYNLDPLLPDHWYSVPTKKHWKKARGLMSIVRYFNGSFVRALVQLFPEVGIDKMKFHFSPRSHWMSQSNRREFFRSLAEEKGFDPLNPTHWYSIHYDEIAKRQGGKTLLSYYNASVVDALINVFPEIGLDKFEFGTPRRYWKNEDNLRRFFVDFAKNKGFDPGVAENWYSVSARAFKYTKGESIIAYYGGKHERALLHLFPNIGLDPRKLLH